MSDETEDEVVMLEIRLARVLLPTGKMAWRFRASDDANCMDMLGLLATGQAYVYEQMKEGF